MELDTIAMQGLISAAMNDLRRRASARLEYATLGCEAWMANPEAARLFGLTEAEVLAELCAAQADLDRLLDRPQSVLPILGVVQVDDDGAISCHRALLIGVA